MRRRDFIVGLSGTAAWPLAARAQQSGRMRRLGALLIGSESADRPAGGYNAALLKESLQKLGWVEGRNLHIDFRFADGDFSRAAAEAVEIVNLDPDVIFVVGGAAIRAVQQRTQTIPIVFVGGGDVAETNLTGGIARPTGNTTGFANLFASLGAKWLELLKKTAPGTTRVAHISNSNEGERPSNLNAEIDAAAAQLGIAITRMPLRDPAEAEHMIDAFSAVPNGALLLTGVPPPGASYDAILREALRHRLPLMFGAARTVGIGVLMSHGPDIGDLLQGAASYIDRILRGAKPGELPVQFPTKFELTINLKTAKAIGIEIPPTVLALANELIE